jgi:hypothetical protein
MPCFCGHVPSQSPAKQRSKKQLKRVSTMQTQRNDLSRSPARMMQSMQEAMKQSVPMSRRMYVCRGNEFKKFKKGKRQSRHSIHMNS